VAIVAAPALKQRRNGRRPTGGAFLAQQRRAKVINGVLVFAVVIVFGVLLACLVPV